MTELLHDSDCATHNAPALPAGPCDCALVPDEMKRPCDCTGCTCGNSGDAEAVGYADGWNACRREAIAAWNRRASPPAAQPRSESMAEASMLLNDIRMKLREHEHFNREALELVEQARRKMPFAQPRSEGWRSIETVPRDGTVVMFWNPHTRKICYNRADDYPVGYWLEKATHWMPLPAPPGVTEQPRSEDARVLLREAREYVETSHLDRPTERKRGLLARIDAFIAAGEGGKDTSPEHGREDTQRLDWLFMDLDDRAIMRKIMQVADAHAMGGVGRLLKGQTPIRNGDFRAAIDSVMPTAEVKP